LSNGWGSKHFRRRRIIIIIIIIIIINENINVAFSQKNIKDT